jgi:hypothetical protein
MGTLLKGPCFATMEDIKSNATAKTLEYCKRNLPPVLATIEKSMKEVYVSKCPV